MTPVNLSFKADAAHEAVGMAEGVLRNGVMWMMDVRKNPAGVTSFTIQTTSDKLEQLNHLLLKTGLNLRENVSDILTNAASQYSEFRDIFVSLDVHHA